MVRINKKSLLTSFVSDPHSAPVTLAKLQTPVKASFEAVNSDLKEVYKALGNYSKALDKVHDSLAASVGSY